jgi:hypothetical protein
MPVSYRIFFQRVIKKEFPSEFYALLEKVDREYNDIFPDIEFASRSPNPIDKRLDFCAYFLAVMKVLDAKGEPFERVRIICIEIVTDYVRPKNRFRAFIKKLPGKLMNTWLADLATGMLHRKVSTNPNPDGFIAHIITDKKVTFGLGYGIDILECGICKLFTKHNFYRYAPFYAR